MTTIDKVAWIQIRDRSLLGARSHGKELIYLPGGKREPGESDEACITREIREELDIALDPATLRLAGTFEAQADAKPDGVSVRMTCYRADCTGEPRPNAEIEELVWLTHTDRERGSAVTRVILDWLHAAGEIE